MAFALASALSLQAQSDRMDAARQDNLPPQGDSTKPLLSAAMVGGPAVDEGKSASDLPDAPSAAKPDNSGNGAPPSPAVKKAESQGAPVAAQGGPLWIDRSVADRNYLLLTGGMVGASVANVELTLHCLTRHASCNDVPSSLQHRSAMYGIGIPADLGIAYLTFCLKRKHNHMWYVPAAAVIGANAFFGYRAYHWSTVHSIP